MDPRLPAELPSEAASLPTRWYHSLGTALLWAMPIANALCDTAVMAMAVKDMEEDESGSIESTLILAGISLFTFIQSVSLSGPSTVKSFKETVAICKTKKIPDDINEWPVLSKNREITSICLASTITMMAGAADFAASYYFIDQAPDDYGFADKINPTPWKIFSICMGSITAFTTVFTEGISTYKFIRRKLSSHIFENPHPHRKLLSKIIGYPLAIVGASENVVEAYASIKNSLSPSTTPIKYTLLFACSPKGVTDFCFSGKISVHAIECFFEKIQHQKPDRKEVVALLLALGTSILVMSPQPALTNALMTDTQTSLPFDSPRALILTLSWGVMLRDGIVQAYTLYPLSHQSVKWLTSKTSSITQYLFPTSSRPNPDLERALLAQEPTQQSIQNDLIIDIPTPSRIYSENKNILFQKPDAKNQNASHINSEYYSRSMP
ncbi:MAG: hypothetical protein P4M12_07180 [Gammaproteobacteria bacterium]|nr:hypothetical protein [Gammaproteobacteria bacterium]